MCLLRPCGQWGQEQDRPQDQDARLDYDYVPLIQPLQLRVRAITTMRTCATALQML